MIISSTFFSKPVVGGALVAGGATVVGGAPVDGGAPVVGGAAVVGGAVVIGGAAVVEGATVIGGGATVVLAAEPSNRTTLSMAMSPLQEDPLVASNCKPTGDCRPTLLRSILASFHEFPRLPAFENNGVDVLGFVANTLREPILDPNMW